MQRDFIFSYLSAESNPNIRAIKQGQRLFYSGHVSSISLLCQGEYFYYRVTVLPSMKKKKYTPTFMIAKQGSEHKVTRAYCDCMGGITGACIHVAASLYALAYICDKPVPNRALASLGIAPTSLSCQWLPACEAKVKPRRADTLHFIKHEKGKQKRARRDNSAFDPRPPEAKRVPLHDRVNKLCKTMESIRKEEGKTVPSCIELILGRN